MDAADKLSVYKVKQAFLPQISKHYNIIYVKIELHNTLGEGILYTGTDRHHINWVRRSDSDFFENTSGHTFYIIGLLYNAAPGSTVFKLVTESQINFLQTGFELGSTAVKSELIKLFSWV